MSARLRKREMDLARRIAAFSYDYDTYGFIDLMETGETLDEAVERLAHDTYRLMDSGDFDSVFSWVDENPPDEDSELRQEYLAISEELEEIMAIHGKTILRNLSRKHKEMITCN